MIDKLNKVIENLEDESKNEKIDMLFDIAIKNKTLLTRYDIVQAFGIKITTFNQIQGALRNPKTTVIETEKIRYIISKIASYDQAINLINDKVIKSGSRNLNKNTMAYLLKEEKEENDMVIINVSVNNDKENITLEKILNAKEKR